MGDSAVRPSWSWGLPTYESRKNADAELGDVAEEEPPVVKSPLPSSRRMSVAKSVSPDSAKKALANRVSRLKERVASARDECLELRQEASDLQEYSNAKLGRVTRYLGVLAEKARKLDEVALDSEDRQAPLKKERKKLFNELLTIKGNIRVFVRVRPQFEDEGPMAVSFPDDYTIRVSLTSAGNVGVSPGRKEFEFDRVYGPHVGQASIFQDVQPLVQSALDGYNVCMFAYGQTGAGKTHTMEGPSHDRGLYFRAFEELFDLSITDSTSTSKYLFFVTMFELHNEQVRDLLGNGVSAGVVQMGTVSLAQQRVDNPADFARVFRMGNQSRVEALKSERVNRSHLIVTVHIHYSNTVSGEKQYSKLSMVDMAGSERLSDSEARGNRLTESLHVNKALSALGDVVSALTAKKENVPYSNSKLTEIFSDALGGEAKTLVIINLCPSYNNVQETVSSLNFATRARNVELTIGNRDTIKKWRDLANDARKESYEKEKLVSDLQQEIMRTKKSMKDSDDQCLLLFNEVQKAWKVAFDLQAELGVQQAHISKLKVESSEYGEKYRLEKERNSQLSSQVAQLSKIEQDQRIELLDRGEQIQVLEAKIKELQQQVPRRSVDGNIFKNPRQDSFKKEETETVIAVKLKLEEELSKRDELIERLHQENEKLFERLTDKSVNSPKVPPPPENKEVDGYDLDEPARSGKKTESGSVTPGTVALLKSTEKVKTTPAGEYLTSALEDFNPDQYEGPAAIADGANKLLMLVLAAVIKAGAAREHEMLAEIRGAVFSFIRKMEPLKVMDTMLVSRVRILYIRSLLSRSSDLQAIKMPPVERFLERASASRSRGPSRGSSPARSPIWQDSNSRKDFYEDIPTFKVQLKQERKSKFSSIVLKLRGIDQETWKQHITGAKLREMTEDARQYAVSNKMLAALFVHTPAGELQRQIRAWLAENFDFLSLTGGESNGGGAGHLELLSTAIMDGWMAGLGMPSGTSTDALGQLLSDYTKRVYTSQLQHLKDVAATLATEDADDLSQISKLRSALESVEHKRRRILQSMRTDVALLTKEEGGSPLRNPPTATEDARLASLISIEEIVRSAQDILSEVSHKSITATRKRALSARVSELYGRMSSLLAIDQGCAQRHLMEMKKAVESVEEQPDTMANHSRSRLSSDEIPVPGELSSSSDWGDATSDLGVQQWSVLQFNNGTATPFVIKCGATPSLELVVRAQASLGDKSGRETVAPVPVPAALAGLSLDEMREVLSPLPEALCQLALARTADGTRARYARLYKTLAVRVPALRGSINGELVTPSPQQQQQQQLQRQSLSSAKQQQ
ncbi:kinesin-like protein KIN-14L [Selaginella moellendorffii]|uniref:kinesin-like protein KIN-14L n=1 Tax=Selaginella moellendorffii TaxID=88036 RepID=UPI000D1C3857|nr:kinesin-like protein KIN-14L [Selaginella moellendorffii]|eukprot:XP_024538534.1 kinesin-like protein KIN-14L [Selaginella moellendorffii]